MNWKIYYLKLLKKTEITKAVTLKSDPIPRLICLRIGTRMLNYILWGF